MKVRIEPAGFGFDADGTATLLQSAEAAGIELPSSCRNGTCRTCICKMLAGEVRYRIGAAHRRWPGAVYLHRLR